MEIPSNQTILARLKNSKTSKTKTTSTPKSVATSLPLSTKSVATPTQKPGIAKLEADTAAAKKNSDWLNSPLGLLFGTIKGLPGAALQVGKDLAQGAAREAGAIGQEALNVLTLGAAGREIPAAKTDFGKKVGNFIYGTEEPVSLQSVGEEYPFVPKGSPIAPWLGAAGFATNFFGGASDDALKMFSKEAAKLTNEGDIAKRAKELLKVTDEVATQMGRDYVNIPDSKTIFDRVKKGSAAPIPATTKEAVPSQSIPPVPIQKVGPSIAKKNPSPVQAPTPIEAVGRSLVDDTTRIAKEQDIDLNLERMDISDAARELIKRELDEMAPQIRERVGRPLTHKEITEVSKESGKILTRAAGRDSTRKYTEAVLNLRRTIARQAEDGEVSREFLTNLQVLKSQGTDIARKLNALAIKADPREMTGKQAILEAVMRTDAKIDEVLAAAKGVNFDDPKQAIEFYRKFIAPTKMEWLDLLRYNSMLSSPKTHFINLFSNTINSTLIAATVKAFRGGFDLLSSKLTGAQRKHFAGEAGAYLKGYATSVKSAVKRFGDVWKGARDFTNLDYRTIPLATKGNAARVEKFLAVPTRVLEGADQFFMELVRGGEKAALQYRTAKGVPVKNIEEASEDAAKYFLYRQETKKEGQGGLLNAMDTLTNTVMRFRNDPNPWISLPSKFTFPFIATPTNILKQGIEFSPLGFATMIGAKDKQTQAIKAMMGTGVAIAAGTLIASNRMTWSEPQTTAERNAFREAGMQPYSIKFGDKWYSYQKLPPTIAFPLSMVAVINEALNKKKIDDGLADTVLAAFSQYAEFFADQSYFKSMGDLWSAINGDEYALERLIGNYPQQLIPYRALTGWLARLTDQYDRQLTPGTGFVDKQMQLLMMQYPGLRQQVAPRTGVTGEPIEVRNPITRAFSPVDITQQTEAEAKDYDAVREIKGRISTQSQKSDAMRKEAETIVESIKGLDKAAAVAKLEAATKGNKPLADKVKDVIAEQKKNYTYSEKLISSLGVENTERARYIVDQVNKMATREEKLAYLENLTEKKLISDTVKKQIKLLLQKQKTP